MLGLLVAGACSSSWGAMPSGSQILQNLRTSDAAYAANGFTVGGTRLLAVSPFGPGVSGLKEKWRLTVENDTAALSRKIVGGPILAYVPPGTTRFVDHDERGNARITVTTEYRYFQGPQKAGEVISFTTYIVAPNGDLMDTVVGPPVVRLADPEQPDRAVGYRIQQELRRLGRGLSEYIREIDSVKRLPGGRLAVSAIGVMGGDDVPGRWDFVVEADAAWMLREARFSHESLPEKVSYELSTSGVVWEGGLAMPASSEENPVGPVIEGDGRGGGDQLVIDTVRNGVDIDLLRTNRMALLPPFPDGTTVYETWDQGAASVVQEETDKALLRMKEP